MAFAGAAMSWRRGGPVGETNYNRATLKTLLGRLACALVLGAALAACSHRSADLAKPATQDNFGVQMAQMNLWREAMFRFQRAVQINPGDAMAHNNLAVAYEANGDFENAAKEYKEALRLDRSNSYIQKNYSRYTEFISRSKKRQKTPAKTAATKMPDRPAAMASPESMSPPAPPSTIPGTGSVPPGIISPPEVPLPAPPPERRPPGGL
jgi:tetratricopeptide (TPR) repeat protein